MERIIRHESFARRIDFRFLQVVQLHPRCGVNTDPLEIRYSILLSRDIYEEIIDQPNRAHFSIHEEIHSIFARRSRLLKRNN